MKKAWGEVMVAMVAMVTTLAGCASSSGVTQLDRETYMLTASSMWRGNDGVAIEGLRQADAYCRNLGRRMRIVGSERSEGLPVVLPPKALLMFKCDAIPGQARGAANTAPATAAPVPAAAPAPAPVVDPAKNPGPG